MIIKVNSLVLESFDDERLFLTVEPKLAESLDGRVNSINHPQYTNSRTNFGILSHIVICAKQLESSIRSLKRLPIDVVELEIKD